MKRQINDIQKNEEKIAQGKKTKEPKRKRQGTGIHEDVAFDITRLTAIPLATSILRKNWFEGMVPY